MSLSVVILSANADNLRACVSFVQRNEPDIDIIVVDDGAKWDNLPVRYVDGVKPFVFARNANIGIAAAGDNDVILLNDDALLLTRNGFAGMHAVAKSYPDVGILSAGVKGVVCNPAQRPQEPASVRYAGQIVAFVCVLIPRAILDKIGPLDERFTGYGEEDRDYCIRVMASGKSLAVYDGCVVDHTGHMLKSTFRTQQNWVERYNHNRQLINEKYGEGDNG